MRTIHSHTTIHLLTHSFTSRLATTARADGGTAAQKGLHRPVHFALQRGQAVRLGALGLLQRRPLRVGARRRVGKLVQLRKEALRRVLVLRQTVFQSLIDALEEVLVFLGGGGIVVVGCGGRSAAVAAAAAANESFAVGVGVSGSQHCRVVVFGSGSAQGGIVVFSRHSFQRRGIHTTSSLVGMDWGLCAEKSKAFAVVTLEVVVVAVEHVFSDVCFNAIRGKHGPVKEIEKATE